MYCRHLLPIENNCCKDDDDDDEDDEACSNDHRSIAVEAKASTCFAAQRNMRTTPQHERITSKSAQIKLMAMMCRVFTHLLSVDELTGAEVALLGGADDGEDGHEGGNEVHVGHHG